MMTFEEVSANVTANQQLYKDKLNWTGLKIIYGLFRQGQDGDAPAERPQDNSGVAQFKWTAWDSYRGMPQSNAKSEYVLFVENCGLYSNNIQ
jgi:acyl-CoA-binding protein